MPTALPKAYEGDRDYVFACYAHADRDAVLPIIAALVDEGYRVWYDDGIELAEDYPEYVADHVRRCASFVMFVSEFSLASAWCKSEVNYALDLNKRILPIYLQNVELTPGLQMRMGHKQALFWYECESDEAFYKRLFKARRLEDCLTNEGKSRRGVKPRDVQAKGGVGTAAVDAGGSHTLQIVDKPSSSVQVTQAGARLDFERRLETSETMNYGVQARFLKRMAQGTPDKARNRVPGIEPKDALAEYSWAELKKISRAIAEAGSDADWRVIAKDYHLVDKDGKLQGDTKSFKLNDGTDASVRILGFRHDELADGKGKAGISFEFANVPKTHRMNTGRTNAGGWERSEMRDWLRSGFSVLLPDDLLGNVAEVTKHTNNVGKATKVNDTSVVSDTADRLWLLSMSEFYGRLSEQTENIPWSVATYDAEGTQYQLYGDNGVTTKNHSFCKKPGAGSCWWLRSPLAGGPSGFLHVLSSGDWSGYYSNYGGGVSPGFCF
ncbi:MAG: TIR domain-containing protein [Coriobacteriales bacterium]|nr:TIR domain-containing protein [Coriobacteriales bacterium]